MKWELFYHIREYLYEVTDFNSKWKSLLVVLYQRVLAITPMACQYSHILLCIEVGWHEVGSLLWEKENFSRLKLLKDNFLWCHYLGTESDSCLMICLFIALVFVVGFSKFECDVTKYFLICFSMLRVYISKLL